MASTNKTANLNLNQWSLSDKPEMADFNADNTKIDTVVSAHLAESVTDASGVHGLVYEEGVYTPVISASSGSITAYTLHEAKYTKIGRIVHVFLRFTIDNAGTGTSNLLATLPYVNSGSFTGFGREIAVSGKALAVLSSGSNISIRYYDNTVSIANGTSFYVGATYTV